MVCAALSGRNDMPTQSEIKIAIKDLKVSYQDATTGRRHLALEAMTLDIREGEFLVVVGPSGCGKSTLLSTISGFIPAQSGVLTMNGQPVRGPGRDRGVVFQDYALLPWKKVVDNVALGLKFRGISKFERKRVAKEFLALAGLADAAEKFPHELSGGMRQRAAVARTLANEPEVILMDEPFAAVDAQTRMTLQEELVRIWAQTRATVFFVTHSVEEAIFLGDRVIVLDAGPGPIKADLRVDIDRSLRVWPDLNNNGRFQALREDITALVRKSEVAVS